ncbi:MAG: hypothetical protein K0S57_3570 [Ramlibacter sp.]|nr:hypothetical protein [Ramlibacter sp.]
MIGQEAALELGGFAQLVGLGVELRVEGDHAAVRFLELAAQHLRLPLRLRQRGGKVFGGRGGFAGHGQWARRTTATVASSRPLQ